MTFLGRLAFHKGHASSLLQFALWIALRGSRDVASFGVLTHPLDQAVRDFYRRVDFEDLPFDHLER